MSINLRGGALSFGFLFMAWGCGTAPVVHSSAEVQEVNLEAQETIEVFLPHPNGRDDHIVNSLQNALVDLEVSENVLGDFRPSQILLLKGKSTPSSAIGRSEGLLFSANLPSAISASFKDTKHYTVVIAWLKPGKEADYEKYLDGIEPAMTRSGGQFLWKLKIPQMPSTDTGEARKGQITFVEWNDTNGFRNVTKSEEYKAHNQYFGSAIEKFEFHWLKTADGPSAS